MPLTKLLLIIILAAPLFAAAKPSDGAVTALPEWLWLPLQKGNGIGDLYGPLADSSFAHDPKKGAFPPVLRLTRPLNQSSAEADAILTAKILGSFNVDLKAPSTIAQPKEFLQAGPDGKFPMVYQVFISDFESQNWVTCIAYVKEGDKVHTIFVQGARGTMSGCRKQFVSLTASPEFQN